MHFGKPVLAFDCNFNRNTTEDKAFFFKGSEDLVRLMETMDVVEANRVGAICLKLPSAFTLGVSLRSSILPCSV